MFRVGLQSCGSRCARIKGVVMACRIRLDKVRSENRNIIKELKAIMEHRP